MKACFFLQRNYAFLGHAIILELKELGVQEFCAYSYPMWAVNFLRTQTDIKYTDILVDEEVIKDYKNEVIDYDFLKKMEDEYGDPNLARFIFLDRFIMADYPQKSYSYDRTVSYEDALRMLQLRFRAVINFLEKEKPDVVVFSAIALMSSTILYTVAKKKGIKTLQVATTRVGDLISVMTDHEEYGPILKIFERNLSGNTKEEYFKKASDYVIQFRENPKKYLTTPLFKSPGPVTRSVRAFLFFLTVIRNYYFTELRFDYAAQTPWNYFKERFLKVMRRWRGYSDLFEAPTTGEKYIFYPLHLEPESSISLLAPFYENQIALVRNIALSAPSGHKIYVKEHPHMVDVRPRGYYRQLLNIPNVRLIDPKISSFELIKNSSLITTITGTAGWEAVILKKPVITFGNCFFNIFSGVIKSENPEQLPFLIKNQIDNSKYNENEVVSYLAAVFEDSVSSDLYNMWSNTPYRKLIEGRMAKGLAEYLYRKM